MTVRKSSIDLTREQIAEIIAVYNTVFQGDQSLTVMTLCVDPWEVTTSEWDPQPDVHPFIALGR